MSPTIVWTHCFCLSVCPSKFVSATPPNFIKLCIYRQGRICVDYYQEMFIPSVFVGVVSLDDLCLNGGGGGHMFLINSRLFYLKQQKENVEILCIQSGCVQYQESFICNKNIRYFLHSHNMTDFSKSQSKVYTSSVRNNCFHKY